ncbi:MAG: PLP-dependent aminotransferase family protein, partial [Myxococcota bacterium]
MPQALWTLECALDRARGDLSGQIATQLRSAIERSVLRSGDRLPASRKLARELDVARGTVVTAIELLVAEGVLCARAGAGVFVSSDASLLTKPARRDARVCTPALRSLPKPDVDESVAYDIDFRPCRPSLEAFPMAAWSRCASLATARTPQPDYGEARGSLALRETIADYVRRARGMSVSPDEILITNGAVHAMHVLSRVAVEAADSVAVEDPGYPLARQVFSLAGAKLHHIPVDDEGL